MSHFFFAYCTINFVFVRILSKYTISSLSLFYKKDLSSIMIPKNRMISKSKNAVKIIPFDSVNYEIIFVFSFTNCFYVFNESLHSLTKFQCYCSATC